MIDNIYMACKRDDCVEWYHEQKADAKKWAKLKRWYMLKVPMKDQKEAGSKISGFKILDYQAECKAEEQMIRDGVYEMMHLVAFQQHAAKPKHFPPRGSEQGNLKKYNACPRPWAFRVRGTMGPRF